MSDKLEYFLGGIIGGYLLFGFFRPRGYANVDPPDTTFPPMLYAPKDTPVLHLPESKLPHGVMQEAAGITYYDPDDIRYHTPTKPSSNPQTLSDPSRWPVKDFPYLPSKWQVGWHDIDGQQIRYSRPRRYIRLTGIT